jgi:streptogramin lyase
MNDTPSNEEDGNVLRPFEASETAPLPPIVPSKVVPEPPAPPPADEVVEVVVEEEPAPGPPTAAHPVDPPQAAPPAVPPVSPSSTTSTASTADKDTVTLPRTPFLVGLGILIVALVSFALLWQSAGDDADADAPAPVVAAPPSTQPVDTAPVRVDPPPVIDTSATDAEIAGLNSDLNASRDEVADLRSVVDELQSRPAPALPGDRLRRIFVGSDARFVSSQPESVAVVGAFGGLALINPATNTVVANGNVANAATRVMRTPTSVWLTNYADNQLLRIDPGTNTVAATIPFPGPDGIEKDGDTLVVASFDGEFVARVLPNTGEAVQRVDVGGNPTAILSHPDHGLWAAVVDTGEIVQIDRDSFEILQRVVVGAGPEGLGFDSKYLWVANNAEGTIAKVDPVAGEVVMTVVVGDGPTDLVSVDGSVWVTLTDEGSLVQVDADTGEIITRTPLGGTSAGGGPTGIAYGNAAIWVAMQGEQSVVRIDL